MAIGLLLQFSLASEINEVVKNFTEKARRRPGGKGGRKNRPRQLYKPESIFYSRADAIANNIQAFNKRSYTRIRGEGANRPTPISTYRSAR